MAGKLGRAIAAFSIADESAYGSLDASGLPDVSGLTFTPEPDVTREAISWDGIERPMLAAAEASGAPGGLPPEPETVYASGLAVDRKTGVITLKLKALRCPGSGTVDSLLLARLMRTSMGRVSRAAGATDTVKAGGPYTASVFDATGAGPQEGDLIGLTIGGRLEVTRVTDRTGDVLTVSPALSAAPSAGDIIRLMVAFYPVLGALSVATYPSLAIRCHIPGRRWTAVGCRMRKLTLEATAGGMVIPTVEMVSPWIQDDTPAGYPAAFTAPVGKAAVDLQAYKVYGTLASATAPAHAAHNKLSARKWSLELALELVPLGQSDSGLGLADYEVGSYSAKVGLTATPDSFFDTAQNTRAPFALALGTGPTTAGVSGAGMGFGAVVPCGFLSEYPRPQVEDSQTLQSPAVEAGRNVLDTTAWANGKTGAILALGWVS